LQIDKNRKQFNAKTQKSQDAKKNIQKILKTLLLGGLGGLALKE
jgi:hypothetical protein